jgi:hypothetical protein
MNIIKKFLKLSLFIFMSVLIVSCQQDLPPEFLGVEDFSISLYENFDLLEGVTAMDEEDGDLTSMITYEGEVDNQTPGSYSITYSVSDSSGNITTVIRIVTVRSDNKSPELLGIEPHTMAVFEEFDPMAGVTAMDKKTVT